MSINPYQNGSYPVRMHEIVFFEGQNAQSINILLQGKVDVFISPAETYDQTSENDILQKSHRIFTIGQNIFLSPNDLFLSGKYSFSYRAAEDSNIYVLNTQNLEQLQALLQIQKDYAAYIITSISTLIDHSSTALDKLEQFTEKLRVCTDNLILYFWLLKESYGFSCAPSMGFFRNGLDQLEKLKDTDYSFPSAFEASFFEKKHTGPFDQEAALSENNDLSKTEYYRRLSNLPLELRKNFFSADFQITRYHCQDAADHLSELQYKIKENLDTANTYFERLYSEDRECIFTSYIQAVTEVIQNDSDPDLLLQSLDYIVSKIKEISSIYEVEYCHKLKINDSYMASVYSHAKELESRRTGSSNFALQGSIEGPQTFESLPDELKDSARKILEYSNISRERAELFRTNLESFRRLRDKLSVDTDARNIRSAVSSVFFEIYEAVLKRVIAENNKDRLFHMFLMYAYMDEKLLKYEHTMTLYKLVDKTLASGQYPVYHMKDWLQSIYSMEKDPSIDEFGQDYFDVFREMKKRKEVTDKDKAEYDNDIEKRLKHEINNLFKINQRLCHGQISVYFPILHNDMITKDLSKALVTPERINESIQKVLEVDFSVFHREISYRNQEKGIEKELIMKAIPPDFILVPTFGTRAMMWQEITGRNRSTPGRFILPMFTGEDLDDFIIKLIGNFRWELCRTMMGVAWNDITEKSLTSEYMDYIQFFKKNKDLSEDAKEKIKAQIQKFRNSTKDIFTADYETWIHYESKGILRLNKAARSILYRHCPFTRSIRDSLEKQPVFSDLSLQFNNIRSKQVREIEGHYYKLSKTGIALDPDLEENLRFYKEL